MYPIKTNLSDSDKTFLTPDIVKTMSLLENKKFVIFTEKGLPEYILNNGEISGYFILKFNQVNYKFEKVPIIPKQEILSDLFIFANKYFYSSFKPNFTKYTMKKNKNKNERNLFK